MTLRLFQFDDGKLAILSAFRATLADDLTLASDEDAREAEMSKNLPLVMGKTLYAVGYSPIYKLHLLY